MFHKKKFIEDSDDLEQSSDKGTSAHSKRRAFDSTSRRPSKRRKSEQCNSATQESEQCSSEKKKTKQSSVNEDKRTTQQRICVFQNPFIKDDECLGPKVMQWPKN